MSDTPARSARREATRQRLLDAACAAFAERGFYGTSVEDICERAGFTRGAFYSNFDSREGLFLELYRQQGQELADFVAEVVRRPDLSPVELLLAVIEGWDTRGVERAAWHLLQQEFALHALRDAEAGRAYARTQEGIRTRIADAITQRLEAGTLVLDVPAEQLVRVCMAISLESTTQHLLEPATQPRGELERLFLPRLVDALVHPA